MAAHASAADANPPKGPDELLAAGSALGFPAGCELLEVDGWAPPAVGAEQAVSAAPATSAVAVSVRASFFTVHISWLA
jgi:hypothetical protein